MIASSPSHKAKTFPINVILCIFCGITAALLAVVLEGTALRFAVPAILLVILLVTAMAVNDYQKLFKITLAGFAVSIPLNLKFGFLYRPHVGTTGIIISLSLLLVFSMLALMLYSRFVKQNFSFEMVPLLFVPVVAYLFAGILSLLNASHPELTALDLLQIVTLMFVMIAVMNIKGDDHIRLFTFFLMAGLGLQGLIACIQYATNMPLGIEIFGEEKELVRQYLIGRGLSRAGGTIGHPNVLAYYLEILLPVNFALLLAERKIIIRFFLFITLATGLVALVATLSRGAWVTIPISFGIVLVIMLKNHFFKLRTFLLLFFVALLLLIFLFFSFPLIEKRLTDDDDRSASRRMPMNEATFSIIRQHPVIGAGMNNFPEFFHKLDTTGKSRIIKEKHVVHNMFLWVWAETGIIGLLAFLGIFGTTVIVSLNLLFYVEPWKKALLIGVVAGLLAHLAHGLVDPGFRVNPAISVLIFTLIGLVGAVSINQRKEARQSF